jgi:hypothetical protein
MLIPRTHFKQVPLAVIKKIIEAEDAKEISPALAPSKAVRKRRRASSEPRPDRSAKGEL